ncbi:hypothetical protein HC776_01025 [bacterium]|nr:hypothetical protein [bacterium]
MGRIYRWAGWFGLGATVFFTVVAFVHQLRLMWNVTYITRTDVLLQCLLLAFLILITGLVLSAVAFGISLVVQVGLTTMQTVRRRLLSCDESRKTRARRTVCCGCKTHRPKCAG